MDRRYRWVDVLVMLLVALTLAGVLTQLLTSGSLLTVLGPLVVVLLLGGLYVVARRRSGQRPPGGSG